VVSKQGKFGEQYLCITADIVIFVLGILF